MKTKNRELDVDFIGGQSCLIQAEEKALSDFFKQKKQFQHHLKLNKDKVH